MSSEEIRQSFLEFFGEKGHVIVPSSSLIPEDLSVLLTTAGMQQFKPYYTAGPDALKYFGSQRVSSSQKCFRTTDIDEVGDKTHLTFFEMLGNFSFGPVGSDAPDNLGRDGYFKRAAIHWAYEYVTEILEIPLERITVSIFKGAEAILEDEASYLIWREDLGIPENKIIKAGIEDNFWGPTGSEGPCGPTTEIYVDGVEIWNLVFNEFYFKGSREELLQGKTEKLEKLKNPGVDTGMGLERLTAVLKGTDNIFETDIFEKLVSRIKELSLPLMLTESAVRVLADHLRSSIFLIADGLRPSNKEAGYILRRLLRRILAYKIKYDIHADLFAESVPLVKEKFVKVYPEVGRVNDILAVLESEQEKFESAISRGLKEIEKYSEINGKEAFYLYETFGLPFELIKELAPKKSTANLTQEDFNKEFEKHQEISRAGAEKKFGGHGLLLDTGELKARDEKELQKVTRLHTATHLLQQALRQVLGSEVKQAGSDITAERTRFDFTFSRKLTADEIKKLEDIVNGVISKNLPVNFVELPIEKAKKTGALYFFQQKYPEVVKVYYVGSSLDDAFSKEFCGGPHVKQTGEIGRFKILKEEAVGAGVRRIKADVY